jgi:hypothetical protein
MELKSVYDLHRLKEYEQYPEIYEELVQIWEAVCFGFECVLEKNNIGDAPIIKQINPNHPDEVSPLLRFFLLEFLGLPTNLTFDETSKSDYCISTAELYELISKHCKTASINTVAFLEKFFSEYFDSYIIYADNYKSLDEYERLKYFDQHYIAIIKSKRTNLWYAISPSNIYNLGLNHPMLNGKLFNRITNLLSATNYSALEQLVINIEGGVWEEPRKLTTEEIDMINWVSMDIFHFSFQKEEI